MSEKKPEKENIELSNESSMEEPELGFSSALFINTGNFKSQNIFRKSTEEIGNHSFQNDIFTDENIDLYVDELCSSNAPNSSEVLNFKNCLSSDLLKRLEDGSPIKSCKTKTNKTSDMNLSGLVVCTSEADEYDSDGKEMNRDSHSLFFIRNNPYYSGKSNFKRKCPISVTDEDDSPKDYLRNQKKFIEEYNNESGKISSSNTVNPNKNNNSNFSNISECLEYQNYQKFLQQFKNTSASDPSLVNLKLPINAVAPPSLAKREEIQQGKKIEHSFLDNLDNNFCNLTNKQQVNNLGFLSEKNNEIEQKINNIHSTNSLETFKNLAIEEDMGSLNSTNLSNLSKKLISPINEDISFYPKNFCYSLKRRNESFNNATNVNLTQESSSNKTKKNMDNHNNINIAISPMSDCKVVTPKFENMTQISKNIFDNNNNTKIQIENNNEYYRNPSSMNMNINKMKKTANISNLNASSNRDSQENNLHVSNVTNNTNLNKQHMYGKNGWVCSLCKNFNYEIRIKCNRCGKPQNSIEGVETKNVDDNLKNNSGNTVSMSNPTEFLNYFPDNGVNNNFANKQSYNLNYCNSNYNNAQAKSPSSLINDLKNNVNNFDNKFSSITVNKYDESNEEKFSQTSQQDNNETETEKDNKSNSTKKKKPFVERIGDWVCIKCKNLNFSFRLICNRCQLSKIESEKLFDQYMQNLMNYVKINEYLQNQIISSNSNQCGIVNASPNYCNSTGSENANKFKYPKKSISQTQFHQSNLFTPNFDMPNNGTSGVIYNKKDYFTEGKFGNNSK